MKSVEYKKTAVVLFEDNSDDALLLMHSLEVDPKQKFDVRHCENLRDGLALIAESEPDVVLLDLSLPDSFGIETVKSVQKLFPLLPVIVLTGSDDDQMAMESIEAGAQDYLVKGTVNGALLNRSIKYAIERNKSSIASRWSAAVTDNCSIALIGVSLKSTILTWNTGAEHLFGFSAHQMIGTPIDKLLAHDLNDVTNIFDLPCLKSLSKSKLDREVVLTSQVGRRLWIKMYASPIVRNDDPDDMIAFSLLMKDVTKERETENKLREKDMRLSFAATSAKLGLWDWDVKNNEFKFGDGMYELFKLAKTENSPTLKKFLSLVHDADRKFVGSFFNRNGAFDFDCRIVLENGQVRHIQMKGEVFLDGLNNPSRVAGFCLDITDRKNAEESLKISEETLNLALDASQMGVWEFSLEERVTSRSVLHDGIFGATSERSQWTARIFMEHVHSEDRAFVKAALNDSLVSGRMNLECRIINRDDGLVRWILLQAKESLNGLGKPRMIGTIRDITESKMLEQLAREAHERSDRILDAVVEYAPTGVAMLDPQMRITSVNGAFLKLADKTQEVLLGNKLDHVLPYLEIKKACALVEKGEPAQISRLFAPNRAGEEKFLDVSIWPVKVGERLTGSVLQMSDRTHTVLLERQRDDFVASVAHDIKNPLVGASRLLEILCSEAAQAPLDKHGSYLNVLRDSTQNLLSLVQNLVDVYRYETLAYPCHFEKISSDVLFSSCVQQIKMFADLKNVKVDFEVGTGAEQFYADAIGIRRVLMNLLHNAVKFNKPAGSVQLSVRRDKNKILLTVADTGYGICESERETLFQRFCQGAQGKRNAGGTGLGLYLSKQIISAHQGLIDCKSYTNEGSIFTIELPLRKRTIDGKTLGTTLSI